MSRRIFPLVALLFVFSLPGFAQSNVGGHFGVVFPLVTHADGDTSDITDDFSVGFPVGLTLKKTQRLAFDLELVPVIHEAGKAVDLTVHPGVLYGLGNNYTAGLRAAFEVDRAAWGVSPLLNKSFPQKNGTALFAEVVLPIRYVSDGADHTTAISLAVHFGIGF